MAGNLYDQIVDALWDIPDEDLEYFASEHFHSFREGQSITDTINMIDDYIASSEAHRNEFVEKVKPFERESILEAS